MNCELISDKPKEEEKYFITHTYVSKLERDILREPTNWLWTHNRWKRKKQPKPSI
jgi:KDO2-lipid IV(A) lauroyltransferase